MKNKDEIYLATTDQDKDAVTALHSMCGWDAVEKAKLQIALDDENCFVLLGGCDEDSQPTGYCVVRVQDKSSTGLWFAVRSDREHLKRNRFRTKGLGRALMLAGLNEARVRGAEYLDTYVLSGTRTSDITISMHKKEGFVLVDSDIDYSVVDGKRMECVNNHFRISLLTIADRNDYDKKVFTCDGDGTHTKVFFKYTPRTSHIRELIDGKLTAVCPYCDKDVIYDG